jgi:nucleotide-binding universal stress UspA family protein
MAQVLADERAAAREYVERVEGEVRERGLEVSSEVRTGAASRELVGLAQPDDLIVVATHGRGGMARWFLGSVAEEVARRLPAPVLLVRALPAADRTTAALRHSLGTSVVSVAGTGPHHGERG